MGQFVRANSRPGRRGYAGDSWDDMGDWAVSEAASDAAASQVADMGSYQDTWSPGGGAGSTTEWGPNMGGGTYPQPARRTVFPDAGGGNNQTINPFGGIGRVIGRGIRGLGHKLQGLRGWNPNGTPKTQLQWEEEREQRIAQKRINNILGRDAPATKATNINLDRLYDTLKTPEAGRNLFTEGEIKRGVSPAMRQIYQTPDYKLMDGQGLEGTPEFNRLFTNEDEIRQMIENSNKTTSLRGNDDAIQKFSLADLGINANAANNFNNQVAENINYNTLSGAHDTFTPQWPMGATRNRGVQVFNKKYPNPTKAQFVDELESGNLGGATTGAFSKNVDELFRDTNLDAGFWTTEMGDVNPTFISPKGSFGGNIDINRSQLSEDALKALPKGFWKGHNTGGRVGYNTGGRVGILAAF